MLFSHLKDNIDIDGTSNFAGDVTLQNDLVVTGRIDAEEIHTTFISSSIAQATGSTIFGDATSDSHQFTGSVDVSGSFTVRDGNVVVSDTLTATNIGAFTATGAIDFDNQNMTNVDIDSGVITIDDIDVKNIDLTNLRREMGIISQHTFLFNTTIKENISYGMPESEMSKIIEVAKTAEIHDFIDSLPDKW